MNAHKPPGPGTDDNTGHGSPIGAGARSCRCSAQPAVRVVLPAARTRDHAVDLLLCGHHCRRSVTRLFALNAFVFDPSGALKAYALAMAGERASGGQFSPSPAP